MQCDLCISYFRRDNLTNRVTEFKEKFEVEYLEFAREELKCFSDKDEFKGMKDWKQRLMEGLKDSHLRLLILSPNYLNSVYCAWHGRVGRNGHYFSVCLCLRRFLSGRPLADRVCQRIQFLSHTLLMTLKTC